MATNPQINIFGRNFHAYPVHSRVWLGFVLGLLPLFGFAQSGRATAEGSLKVILFLDTECPVTQSYMHEIRSLLGDFNDRPVSFEAVFPSYTVSTKEITAFFEKYNVKMTGQPDPDLRLTQRYQANTMPEAILLNASGIILYQGAIDNWYYALGKNRPKATAAYLRNAIQASLEGNPILIRKTEAIGCLINKN
ncbi:redoxin domain-containing protein [Dyadobacter tibetensis]|uniref:redoxin domain-containing protein n=1 Tax=Dyadobacter tibetensis TaxID=1211851 RepID=UPI000470B7E1|nr:redoxin domain-containing protein [Dyadobacter tibetensis]